MIFLNQVDRLVSAFNDNNGCNKLKSLFNDISQDGDGPSLGQSISENMVYDSLINSDENAIVKLEFDFNRFRGDSSKVIVAALLAEVSQRISSKYVKCELLSSYSAPKIVESAFSNLACRYGQSKAMKLCSEIKLPDGQKFKWRAAKLKGFHFTAELERPLYNSAAKNIDKQLHQMNEDLRKNIAYHIDSAIRETLRFGKLGQRFAAEHEYSIR